MKNIIFVICVIALAGVSLGAIYKWVDEEGRVHYSDKPTDKHKTKEVEIEPGPSPEEIEKAQEQAEKSKARQHKQPGQQPPSVQSLPLDELGPLPESASSEYVETVAAGISFSTQDRTGSFDIMLKAKQRLPGGAYLEVHFPDPDNPDKPIVVGKVRQGTISKVFVTSPNLKGFKCWNYNVVVYIYRGSSKSKLLGIHNQYIQSRVNLDKIKDGKDLVEAGRKGNCP